MGEMIKFGVKLALAITVATAFFTAITTIINLLTTIVFNNIIGEVFGIMSACLPFNALAVFSAIGTSSAAILSFLVAQKIFNLTRNSLNMTS